MPAALFETLRYAIEIKIPNRRFSNCQITSVSTSSCLALLAGTDMIYLYQALTERERWMVQGDLTLMTHKYAAYMQVRIIKMLLSFLIGSYI